MIEYRFLQSTDELHQVVELEIAVWDLDPKDAVPMNIMRPITMHGGVVVGAYAGDALLGMALAFPARHGRRWVLWSHMAAVRPDAQGRGIGFGLKQAQRTWALAHGYKEIGWTFDPLQRGNANFNLHRLGATASVYHVNYYGLMADAINRNSESDRIEARWKLDDRRVKALAEGRQPRAHYPEISEETLILSADSAGQPVSGEREPGPWLFAEVPRRRQGLDVATLKAWRLALRKALGEAFAAGYTAVDFVENGERSWYVLEAPTAWHLYVLECADGTLYTGISPDVQQRVKAHQAGRGAQYTRSRRPVRLRAAWRFAGRSQALKAEAAFKTLTREAKLRHIAGRADYAGAPWSAVET